MSTIASKQIELKTTVRQSKQNSITSYQHQSSGKRINAKVIYPVLNSKISSSNRIPLKTPFEKKSMNTQSEVFQSEVELKGSIRP